MKRVLSILAAVIVVALIGYRISQDPALTPYTPPAPRVSLVAPTVANDFFAAFCSHDSAYLAANTGGVLTSTEEELDMFFAQTTMQCVGFRYLGSLTPTPGTQQYVYVIDAGVDGEVWFVLSVVDGVAVDLE